ncbi:unnamed protein product, partial [Didymodactylos carnosus]
LTALSSLTLDTVLRGQVIYNGEVSIPSDALLVLELRDTTVQDSAGITIARLEQIVTEFPIKFELQYPSSKIEARDRYSMSVRIESKTGHLYFINEQLITVKPIGNERTETIDIPVIKA